MQKKDITFIVMPNGSDNIREFHFSKRFLWMMLGLLIFVSASSLFYGTGYYIQAKRQSGLKKLEGENRQLYERLQSIEHKGNILKDKMNRLAEQANALRVITELPEIDPDTRMVGIGGHALEKKPTYSFLTPSSGDFLEKSEAEIDRLLRQAALEKASFQEIEKKLQSDQKRRDHTPSILPTYGYISSPFGYRRDPLTGRRTFHKGTDIACRLGTSIYATANGTVTYVKYSKGYGNAIMIDHGYGLKTLYAHLSKMCVKRREKVTRGQKIGEMGKTGRTTGCHLHYEVRKSGRAVNPWYYFYTKEEIL